MKDKEEKGHRPDAWERSWGREEGGRGEFRQLRRAENTSGRCRIFEPKLQAWGVLHPAGMSALAPRCAVSSWHSLWEGGFITAW